MFRSVQVLPARVCHSRSGAVFRLFIFVQEMNRGESMISLKTLLLFACCLLLSNGCRSSTPPSSARSLSNRSFERTPPRHARGQYLYDGVMACDYCHAPYDTKTRGWPPLPGKAGSGLQYSTSSNPRTVAPNITADRETGAGTWTDDMLARAIREGIRHDGRVLDPHMPYEWYRAMSDEDLASLIVYIRSLSPVRNVLPRMEIPEQFRNTVRPRALHEAVPMPDSSSPAKRGEYLVRLAHCSECHTPGPVYRLNRDLEFGGGTTVDNEEGQKIACPNITPDPSGISYYDEAMFVAAIRTGTVGGARKLSAVMPWWFFRRMSDDDLKAIFAYLRTLRPVRHRVDNTEPISHCKVCGLSHGAGALN